MKKTVTVRIDEDLLTRVKKAAIDAGLFYQDWIAAALKAGLPSQQKGKP